MAILAMCKMFVDMSACEYVCMYVCECVHISVPVCVNDCLHVSVLEYRHWVDMFSDSGGREWKRWGKQVSNITPSIFNCASQIN